MARLLRSSRVGTSVDVARIDLLNSRGVDPLEGQSRIRGPLLFERSPIAEFV
jgi:hypothetical protein